MFEPCMPVRGDKVGYILVCPCACVCIHQRLESALCDDRVVCLFLFLLCFWLWVFSRRILSLFPVWILEFMIILNLGICHKQY